MEYERSKYKVYTWRHWTKLHWLLNPGMAINELVLGHRMPKVNLVDKTMDKPRFERRFVPCPHCKTLHDSRKWSVQNGRRFKNWFGLYCPNCGEIIPCIRNIWARVILFLAAPLRQVFEPKLRKQWLRAQPARFEEVDVEETTNWFGRKSWFLPGLTIALYLYLVINIFFPFFSGEYIPYTNAINEIPVCAAAGLGVGYTLKWYYGKTGEEAEKRAE